MTPVITAFVWLSLSFSTGAGLNCRPLQVSFCGSVGYTSSSSPGGVSGFSLQDIQRIIETECSPEVATLICRVVVPECGAEEDMRLKPCRSLCERVRSACKGTLKEKRILWPSQLKCHSLPQEYCVEGSSQGLIHTGSPVCEPISVRLCSDLTYNLTVMPNSLGHQTQHDASITLHTFHPVIQVQCSPVMKEFLCSVFIPECINGKSRTPCRRLCERARAGCEHLMNSFGFSWPESLNCDTFKYDTCDPEPSPTPAPTQPAQCEPISVPLCSDLPYTHTLLPNSLGHRSQHQIDLELKQHFHSLIQAGCSPALKPFLCSVYTPECMKGHARPPCRTLCEEARAACEPLLKTGVSGRLNCEAYDTTSCPHSDVNQILERLNTGGFSLYGNSFTLRTAFLLLTFADADRSGGLNSMEHFNMEQFVTSLKREYVEMNHGQTPPAVDENNLLISLTRRGLIAMDRSLLKPLWRLYSDGNSIDFDNYVAVVTRLRILKDRFNSHLLNIDCECQVASFSFMQFIKTAII